MQDIYLTIARPVQVKSKIQRSLFIAVAREVENETEARRLLAESAGQHPQASHNCLAYRIGLSGDVAFAGDDGEPGGSAGRPILAAIKRAGVTNVAVVVTRYFGGKKLGIRGLIDAYGGIADEALQEAGTTWKVAAREMRLECPYDNLEKVMYIIRQEGAETMAATYEQTVMVQLRVPLANFARCRERLQALGVVIDAHGERVSVLQRLDQHQG